jgi:hypothetical protein
LKDWKTKPIRRRRSTVSRFSASRPISVSPIQTWPEVGRSTPAATCSSVVFPDPEGPMTAVNARAGKPMLTPASAVTGRLPPPYTFVTPRSATAGRVPDEASAG